MNARPLLLACSLALAIGCARRDAATQAETETAPVRLQAALIGGAPAPEAAGSGLVRVLASRGECAGQLLTRQWVLTAAHCLCASDADADATTTSTQLSVATASDSAAVTLVTFHPTLDVALLRLDRILPLAEPIKLWTGGVGALVHRQVECLGHDRALGDAATPAAALVRVRSAGRGPDQVAAACASEASTTGGQTLGFSVALKGGDEDAAASFEPFDAGAPCFVSDAGQRYLTGVSAGESSGAAGVGWVVGIDALSTFIHDSTDIWSEASCMADVPGTQFALDPMIFVGAPTDTALTLMAQHAYGVPGDQKVIVRQTSGARFANWTSLPSPNVSDDVLAVGGAADPGLSRGPGLLMFLYYLDRQTRQRSTVYYDWSSMSWVGLGFLPFTGSGMIVSSARLRVGMDVSGRAPLWVDDRGSVATTFYVASTPLTQTPVNAFVDMYLPVDAPVADAARRPSVIFNSSTTTLRAGYRSLLGPYVTYGGSGLCLFTSDGLNPWCGPNIPTDPDAYATPGQVTVHDIPMVDVRDVGIGLTTLTGETFWAISVGTDNQMRLWRLGADGHARDFGSLGDRALGMVKTTPYLASPGQESLLVSYTGESWSARVRPVGNCLGNTPSGW